MAFTRSVSITRGIGFLLMVLTSLTNASFAQAQEQAPLTDREKALLDRVEKLEQHLAVLEAAKGQTVAGSAPPSSTAGASTAASNAVVNTGSTQAPAPAPPLASSDGTTVNFLFDGYYGYNFNHPVGRDNLLRANDVLSNSFSLNQAGIVVERAADLSANRRFGYRLDLMFGQNTETLQGGAQNELRPQVYRNIFQAYGSYILPVGHGLQLDFGKFASSLGYEGNYSKDQFNYSRAYFFNYLPFYHTGLRATYNLSDKLALQYWLVNGANQTEDFNGFKDQAVLVTYKPTKDISWNINYYEGQEQRDTIPALNPSIPALPTQPGISVDAVSGRHDGRFHVIDSYASFRIGPKWQAVVEGDYVINRVAANDPPARVFGGAGYLHHQLTKSFALNGRFEYLKDRGGLFSSTTQDLKELTGTAVYDFADGFQTKLEYRRDFSNRLFFLTNNPALQLSSQNTATLGLVWWFGGKTGSW